MARGRKTGGRKLGTLNKATVERTLLAERAVAEAKGTSKRLATDVLDDFMHTFAEAAIRFRERGDWDEFGRWALRAVDCARSLAPFQSPKLSTVMVGPAPVTTIEVIGGLPDDQDGGLVDAPEGSPTTIDLAAEPEFKLGALGVGGAGEEPASGS
jgi:hypothetical protein